MDGGEAVNGLSSAATRSRRSSSPARRVRTHLGPSNPPHSVGLPPQRRPGLQPSCALLRWVSRLRSSPKRDRVPLGRGSEPRPNGSARCQHCPGYGCGYVLAVSSRNLCAAADLVRFAGTIGEIAKFAKGVTGMTSTMADGAMSDGLRNANPKPAPTRSLTAQTSGISTASCHLPGQPVSGEQAVHAFAGPPAAGGIDERFPGQFGQVQLAPRSERVARGQSRASVGVPVSTI